MPKKDSTSSDKGASFGGENPPVVTGEGTDMEATVRMCFCRVNDTNRGSTFGWRV